MLVIFFADLGQFLRRVVSKTSHYLVKLYAVFIQQAENIEIQDSLDEPDNGPLTVIRLDEGSVKDKWAEWEKKMAQAQK